MLQEVDVSTVADFFDGYLQQVLVEYNTNTEELLVYLLEHDARRESSPLLQCHLKLADYVKLDNGQAHLGFCQETANLSNVAMIENWTFESKLKTN